MSSVFTVGILESGKVLQILYGLSYNKTLAQKSKFSVDQVERYTGAATSTSFGDNFAMATFHRWVKEEMAYQLSEFAKACKKDTFNVYEFINIKTKARNQYFQINVTAQQEIGSQNKEMADCYTACMKTTAAVQYTAEMALLTVGAFATAPTSLALLGGRVLVGVGSGISIMVAENWSQAKNSDMIVMPVSEQVPGNIVSNIPSITKDWIDVCDGLSKFSLMEIGNAFGLADKQITTANRALKATTDARVKVGIQNDISSIKAQRAKDLQLLDKLKQGTKASPFAFLSFWSLYFLFLKSYESFTDTRRITKKVKDIRERSFQR